MVFNITAKANGETVFQGTMCYIPHKGEYIEVEGHTYVVDNVIHIVKRGTSYYHDVQLLLRYIRT